MLQAIFLNILNSTRFYFKMSFAEKMRCFSAPLLICWEGNMFIVHMNDLQCNVILWREKNCFFCHEHRSWSKFLSMTFTLIACSLVGEDTMLGTLFCALVLLTPGANLSHPARVFRFWDIIIILPLLATREFSTSDNKILNVKRISKVLLQNDAILRKLQNDVALLIFRLKITFDINWMVHFELSGMMWFWCKQVSEEENTKQGGSQPYNRAAYEIGNILTTEIQKIEGSIERAIISNSNQGNLTGQSKTNKATSRLFTKPCHFVPFFSSKSSFCMDFIWKMKSSLFLSETQRKHLRLILLPNTFNISWQRSTTNCILYHDEPIIWRRSSICGTSTRGFMKPSFSSRTSPLWIMAVEGLVAATWLTVSPSDQPDLQDPSDPSDRTHWSHQAP